MHYSEITPLSVGSRGPAVADLQRRLNAAGFNSGTADGVFGANTQRAVVAANERLLGRSSATADQALLNKLPDVAAPPIVLKPITGTIDANTGTATVTSYVPSILDQFDPAPPSADKSLLVGGIIVAAGLLWYAAGRK